MRRDSENRTDPIVLAILSMILLALCIFILAQPNYFEERDLFGLNNYIEPIVGFLWTIPAALTVGGGGLFLLCISLINPND